MADSRAPRIGLVLGSGGLTGTAFHAGVIAGLAEFAGWDARTAELVVGTSAGSTSAALVRAGLPPGDFVARMRGTKLSAQGERILGALGPLTPPPSTPRPALRPSAPGLVPRVLLSPWRYRPGVLASAVLPEGTRAISEGAVAISALFDSWPAEPTWICAVRLDDGTRVVFGRDRAASMRAAVPASCAIPGYYAPVVIDGQRYVDGGMWSTHNLDLVAGLGLDVVVVSAPMSTTDLIGERENLPRIPVCWALHRQVRAVERTGTRVLVVAPDRALRQVLGTRTMRLSRRPAVAEAALAHLRKLARAGALGALTGPAR